MTDRLCLVLHTLNSYCRLQRFNDKLEKVMFCRLNAFTTHKKMMFSIKDFFSECDQVRRKLRIWSHLLKKFLMENFFFSALFHWLRISSAKPKFMVFNRYNTFVVMIRTIVPVFFGLVRNVSSLETFAYVLNE